MKEFKHSTGKNYFVITKRCADFHLEYDCIVQHENECKTFCGLRLEPVIEMYEAWCIEHNAKVTDIAELFEPYHAENTWEDIENDILIDDDEIIP